MQVKFLPTEEQAMTRAAVRRYVSRDYRHERGTARHWRDFAEAGWLMLAVSPAHGGLGGDAYDEAVIAEELGRGLVRAPFVEIALTAAALLSVALPDRLPALAKGAAMPLLAHDEPGMRGEFARLETRAEHVDGAWRLSGRKSGLIGAPFADLFVVSALTATGPALFHLPPRDANLLPYTTIDDRAGGELHLAESAAGLLAAGDVAAAALAAAIDHALVLECAEALGTMQAAFELTREYLLTRRQYGRLIGDFQVLRHRLADMFTAIEQSRSIVLRGCAALCGADAAARARVAAATRVFVAQSADFVAAQTVQLHGGIGMTEEYAAGHYFKRLTVFAARHGGAEAQLARFAAMAP